VCLIVDANLASTVFASPPHPDFAPVLDWLDKQDGRIVFGGRLAKELEKLEKARRYLRTLLQAGRAWRLLGESIDQEEAVVEGTGLCRSNDPHVIALARISGARTLCTNDRNLERDFKNLQLVSNPKGSIYKRRTHARLLRHTRSCRRSRQALGGQ
jgi:predicted nucleic acid-binding protein